jgi:hypothetical protein
MVIFMVSWDYTPSDFRNPSGNPSDLDIFDMPHIAPLFFSGSFSSCCKKGPNAASWFDGIMMCIMDEIHF